MNNYKEKILNLLDNSKLSLIEHELKIISFISALTSYKADSLLRPLPNDFFNDSKNKKVEDFDRLREIVKQIPNINELNETTDLSIETWKLIYWILTVNSIQLELLNKDEVKQLYSILKLNTEDNKQLPHFVFKINSSARLRSRFNQLKDENGCFKAYHGTKFENLHSIMHNGLVNNLNKRDAFGSGTYLSKKLDVAILFSPYSFVKSNSLIKKLSCILLCDVVQHPSVILKENSSYCLVQDDDFVNVTHVLVYAQMDNNRNGSFLKYELMFLFLGFIVILYSIYRNNNRY